MYIIFIQPLSNHSKICFFFFFFLVVQSGKTEKSVQKSIVCSYLFAKLSK